MAESHTTDTVTLELTTDEETAETIRELKDGVIVDFDLSPPPTGMGVSGRFDGDGSYRCDLQIEFRERVISDDEDTSRVTADEIELVIEGEDETMTLEDVDVEVSDGETMAFSGDGPFTGSFTVTSDEAETLFDTLDTEDHSLGDPPAMPPRHPSSRSSMTTADVDYDEMDVDYTTREFEVDPETAQSVFDKVKAKVEQARKDGFEADEMIVGVPQYKALAVHANNYYGDTLGPRNPSPENLMAELGVEIIAVPGPMMHVVKENGKVLFEHG